MRVVLAVHTFFPRSSGGTEVYTLALAKRLAALGNDVVIVTCESNLWGNSPEVTAVEDVWEDIPVQRLHFNVLRTPNPVLYDYDNPYIEAHLRQFFKDQSTELVQVCHPGNLSTATIAAAKSLGLPVVTMATDFWYVCPVSQLLRHDRTLCAGPYDLAHCLLCYVNQRKTASNVNKLLSPLPVGLVRWGAELCRHPWAELTRPTRMVRALGHRHKRLLDTLDSVDYIVSPSQFLRDGLVRNGVPAGKTIVSAHGIERQWAESLPRPKQPANHLRFAFAGMIGWHKGTHIAVQAFESLPRPNGATLTIYGNNEQFADYYRELEPLIEQSPNIVYGGLFAHSQISEVLSEIDILVMPSMWYENTPVIMYEAFASRTPVIATHEGGMAELIELFHGGWTFPRGDVDALASLMQSLIDSPELVAEAREKIKPVRTIDEHVSDLLEIYDRARGGRT
ncbi:MAG: glycosyltransferase [Anaerolineae bacterium]